jgi:hypothetical protein
MQTDPKTAKQIQPVKPSDDWHVHRHIGKSATQAPKVQRTKETK